MGCTYYIGRLLNNINTLTRYQINDNVDDVDNYAPEIEDRGAYCFCPVCHSVILSSSLKL